MAAGWLVLRGCCCRVPTSRTRAAWINRTSQTSQLPACLRLCPSHLPHTAAAAPAGLCITTVVSYLSHSQVWAAQAGSGVMVGGSTNRAKLFFEQELSEVLGAVPELPAAPALVDAAPSGGGGGGGSAQ